MRRTVKSVSPHPVPAPHGVRQPVDVSLGRERLMKGRVEDRHVPGVRQHGAGRPEALQVLGIVQRRQFVQSSRFPPPRRRPVPPARRTAPRREPRGGRRLRSARLRPGCRPLPGWLRDDRRCRARVDRLAALVSERTSASGVPMRSTSTRPSCRSRLACDLLQAGLKQLALDRRTAAVEREDLHG